MLSLIVLSFEFKKFDNIAWLEQQQRDIWLVESRIKAHKLSEDSLHQFVSNNSIVHQSTVFRLLYNPQVSLKTLFRSCINQLYLDGYITLVGNNSIVPTVKKTLLFLLYNKTVNTVFTSYGCWKVSNNSKQWAEYPSLDISLRQMKFISIGQLKFYLFCSNK